MSRTTSRARASLGALALLGAVALLGPTAAPAAGTAVSVEIRDRDAARTLPVHWHEGRGWVEGQPRHEYEIRLHNRSPHRVLAVVSVDGVNVVSGETAAPSQSGYVLEPWQSTSIDGWRKSLDRVAAFRFTRLANSYAARTGRPADVGVIGVAVFRERPPPRAVVPDSREIAPSPADAQRSASPRGTADDSAAETASAARRARGEASAPVPPVAQHESAAKAESRLGTAHGRRLESHAQWTNFERASSTPDELHTLWYDSRANLVAMGVLPPPDRYADRTRVPQPFPGGFVPDP